jgi:hypothetical protein
MAVDTAHPQDQRWPEVLAVLVVAAPLAALAAQETPLQHRPRRAARAGLVRLPRLITALAVAVERLRLAQTAADQRLVLEVTELHRQFLVHP